MRTPEEIAEEIARLRKVKPPEAMGAVIAKRLALAISELESPGKLVCEALHWPTVMLVRRWVRGESNTRPSEGWGQEKPA